MLFALFRIARQRELKKAFEAKDKKLHDALISMTPSRSFFRQELMTESASLSAEIVEKMNFDRVRITQALFDLAYTSIFADYCDLAKIVAQARAFVSFRSLHKHDMISPDETKKLMAFFNVNTATFKLLQKSDIDHLNLQIDRDS